MIFRRSVARHSGMTMSPRWRKVALVAHVSASVGWLGAVIAFLALAVTGMATSDLGLARAAYRVMEPLGWYVIVSFNLASLLSGLVSSLGTAWGLLRHYWIIFKLLINVLTTVVLLIYMQTLASITHIAADPSADLKLLRNPSPVLHTGATVVLLLITVILAVYKPKGMTAYGWRRQAARRIASPHRAPGPVPD